MPVIKSTETLQALNSRTENLCSIYKSNCCWKNKIFSSNL